MNLNRNQPEIHCGISRLAFLLLSPLFLASQLVFPSTIFALSTQTASSADPPALRSLALSEVAVVRLIYNYNPASTTTGTAGKPVLCTSQGVLVKSFPASSPSASNSWVLTDGSLLNTAPLPCGPTGSSSRGKSSTTYFLSSIQVYANTAYTGNASAHALLGTYTTVSNGEFLCVAIPCTNSGFFFSFHTDQLQPTLDVATTNTISQSGIALTSQASATARPPVPLSSTAAAVAFLTPTAVLIDVRNSQNEEGMPFINTNGQMIAMHIQGNAAFTSDEYNTFVAQQSILNNAPANPLQAAWENGITAYYQQHYQEAIKDFQFVEAMNPGFEAAKTFELKATALKTAQSNPGSRTSVPAPGTATFFGIPRSTFLIIGIAVGSLLFIVFLIILSVWTRRKFEFSRFKAAAQSNAEREVQQMQQTKLQLQTEYDQPLDRQKALTVNPQSIANQLCPNCGHSVLANATYCPNCRSLLSPITKGASQMLTIPPEPELPVIRKTLLSSQITSQQQLGPIKEIETNNLAISEALKHLWEKAEP
jgi:hypothetical protein